MISINYWGIVGAAIASMVVGMLWYGPLFGKHWKRMMSFSDSDMKKMPLSAGQAICGGAVTALVMSYVLATGAYAGGANPFMLAFWPWLGYVATTQAGSFLWEGKPFKLFAFNAAESLVAMFAMALVLTFA